MLRIDTSGLNDLAKALRKAAPEVSKEFGTALRAAGVLVANEAKQRAGFSSRIPGSIRVRRSATQVKVMAGNDNAPHAAAFEHKGEPGTFRHPVYGNQDVWVAQPAHPYLTPAAEAREAETLVLVMAAVDTAFERAGFS